MNKDRAKQYAEQADTPMRWSVARDVAGLRVLQNQDCNAQVKVRWLQYHDRFTGDVCGMLPLAIGMPVALTDHTDRSEKKLLRG
eukprot:4692515-Amphidinium_carterae.4